MRIGYAMELVLNIAVGLLVVRIGTQVVEVAAPTNVAEFVSRALTLIGAYFLSGFALVGALGLVVEAARRRSPEHWGLGRWSWVFAGLFVLACNADRLINFILPSNFPHDKILYLVEGWGDSWHLIGPMLGGLWVITRMARLPRDPAPDAREWAGRVLGISLVVFSVIAMTEPWWWGGP